MNGEPRSNNTWAILSHLGVLIPQWGWVLPLVVFLSYRDRDRFVAHHAIQALVWQLTDFAVGLVLGLVGMIGWFIGIFGSMANQVPPTGPEAFLATWGLMLFGFIAVQVYFVIVAVIAAVAVSRGEAYVYPLVGGLATRLAGE